MAAVPVSLMHHSGLQIPTQMMTPAMLQPACSINNSMLSMNVAAMTPTMTMAAANSAAAQAAAMNYPQFQSQPQVPTAPQQIQPQQTSNEHFLNGEAAMSPSRSAD